MQQHDGPRGYHTKSEKDKYHYWHHSYTESHLKYDTNEPIYKIETLTDFKNKFRITKGEMWFGRDT